MQRPKSHPKTNLHTNACRLVDSDFISLNSVFSFTLEACCDLVGFNRQRLLPFSGKDSCLTRDISGQSVYCNPPWSFAIQRIKTIRTCHAKSPINTNVAIVLLQWPQFNATISGRSLLRQVPTNILVFTKPSPLGKRHSIVKGSLAYGLLVHRQRHSYEGVTNSCEEYGFVIKCK